MSLGKRFRVSGRTRPIRVLPDVRPRARRQDRVKRRVCQLPLLEKGPAKMTISSVIFTATRGERRANIDSGPVAPT